MGSAYNNESGEGCFLPSTRGRFSWSAYFSNVVVAAQASTAALALSDGLTEANFKQVMTVDLPGEHIVAGIGAPCMLVNGREYSSAVDTLSYTGRWLVGCCPAPDIAGAGYAVAIRRSELTRAEEAEEAVGMYLMRGVATPSALTALSYGCKGVPQESVLLEVVEEYPTKGFGVAMANLGDTPDKWLGVKYYEVNDTGTECTVYFSRPYAHPPVVCLGTGTTAVSIGVVDSDKVLLHIHSEILERRVWRSIIAVGFVA